MNYSLKIIKSKTTNESYAWTNFPSGPNNWEKLLGQHNENFIVSNKKELALVDFNGNCLWKKNIICPGTPNNIWISDNRLLATTSSDDYHSWGFLGPAIIIDLDKGTIINEVKGAQGESLTNGQFLIGLEGYGVFDTWMYGDNGKLIQQWKSYGHYIVGDNNDIRVIEQDRNTPTNAYVVRLKLDGTIQKGIKLETPSASEPIVLNNGDIIFINFGKLKIVDLELNLILEFKLLKISKNESWRYISKIQFDEKYLKVEIFERTKKSPIEYHKYEWLVEIKNK